MSKFSFLTPFSPNAQKRLLRVMIAESELNAGKPKYIAGLKAKLAELEAKEEVPSPAKVDLRFTVDARDSSSRAFRGVQLETVSVYECASSQFESRGQVQLDHRGHEPLYIVAGRVFNVGPS